MQWLNRAMLRLPTENTLDREEKIMTEWQTVRLGEIVKTNQSTYSPKENWQFVNYLDTGNITMNKIDEIQYINSAKDKLPSRARRKVKTNSIIYSTVRPNQLHYGIIKKQPDNFLVSTGFTVIDVNYDRAVPDFIYYALTKQEVTEQLQAIAEQSVSAYPSLKPSDIENLEFMLPDKKTQERIVAILSSIDEKIKENSAINNNLFDQAVTLYNNKLETAEDISSTLLGNIADVKGGKRLPKGKNLTTEPTSHPYIRVRDLNNVIFASLDSNYEYVDEETQKTISRYIVSSGDVLISIVGTIGLTAIVDDTLEAANLTENCVKLTNLKYVTPEYLLLYLRSNAGQEAIAKSTVGAVQLKLPLKNIQALPVPLLNSKEFTSLNEILAPIFAKISNNVIENRKLFDLREAILPKLLSGELDVSAIEL